VRGEVVEARSSSAASVHRANVADESEIEVAGGRVRAAARALAERDEATFVDDGGVPGAC
jgi:hypothetical protein